MPLVGADRLEALLPELAEIVGTTRSRVGYFLKRFRTAGLIERPSQAALLINEARLDEYLQTWL